MKKIKTGIRLGHGLTKTATDGHMTSSDTDQHTPTPGKASARGTAQELTLNPGTPSRARAELFPYEDSLGHPFLSLQSTSQAPRMRGARV